MFPDKASEWEGFPSIIDGIRYPYVHIVGSSPSHLHLLVTGEKAATFGYGISIQPVIYLVVDEYEYSVTGHGLPSLACDGSTYIKRARQSNLLQMYNDEILRRFSVEHFAFGGGGDCVEVLVQQDFSIIALASKADRDEWTRQVFAQILAGWPA